MLKNAPRISNHHDTIVDWREYIDGLEADDRAEFVLSAFEHHETIVECLLYASLHGIPVLFVPENKAEKDYHPHDRP